MFVTLLGIVTLIRLVQPMNAESPMVVTLFGDRDAGQAGAGIERLAPECS